MNNRQFRSPRDVMIQMPDMSQALKFYSEVLGFLQTLRHDKVVGFETGSFQLFIEQGTQPEPVFELRVPDLETAKQRLPAAGCHIIEDNPQLPRLYMRDPFGLTFNLGPR